MDPRGKDERLPISLYGLIGLGVCAVSFAAYGWLIQKWGGLVILLEVGIVVVAVIVGLALSMRRSRREHTRYGLARAETRENGGAWKTARGWAASLAVALAVGLAVSGCARRARHVHSLEISPLSEAVGDNDLDTVEALLAQGAQVNAIDDSGFAALHWAAMGGKLEIAQCLVEHGADVNVRSRTGCTPLHPAARTGELDMIQYLLASGAEVDARIDDRGSAEGNTPLHSAAIRGQLAAAKLLLEHGADVNAQNAAGETPVQLATPANQNDAVRGITAEQRRRVAEFLRAQGAKG
jgi:hypothetical protein